MTDARVVNRSPARRRGEPARQGILHSVSEKAAVAAVTALVTGLLTLAGPPLHDWAFSAINETEGVSPSEAKFQQEKWQQNASCANVQPVWHETGSGAKMDATICPGTGDILLVLKDHTGRQTQWWSDNRSLTDRFSKNVGVAAILHDALFSPAHAQNSTHAQRSAQNVMCQIMLPDNRGLRRRIMLGPDHCVELIIDTWTGNVVHQRRIPCVPNCMVNV